MNHEGELLDELWGNVHVHPDTGCWEYMGTRLYTGYCVINYKGKQYSAHRLALEIKLGRPLEPGMVAAHSVCDFKPCVCPQHLSEWTQAQNIEDRDLKGRTGLPKGEANSQAWLTADEVLQIKRLLAKGNLLQREIAEMFNITPGTICDIKNGRSWTHLPCPDNLTE